MRKNFDFLDLYSVQTLKARLTKLGILPSYPTMSIVFWRLILFVLIFLYTSLSAEPPRDADHFHLANRLYAHSLKIVVESGKVSKSRDRIQNLVHHYRGFISKSTSSNIKFKIPFASQDHFLIELRNLELVDKTDETIQDITDPFEECVKKLEIDHEFLSRYRRLFEEDKIPKRDRRHLLVKQHRVSLDIQKMEKRKRDMILKTKFSDFTILFVPIKHGEH